MTRQFTIGSLRFQEGSRLIERTGGEPVKLSHGEYLVLLALCTCGICREDSARRLDNCIYRLRRKLGLEAHIINDWKNGYRLLNATEEKSQ